MSMFDDTLDQAGQAAEEHGEQIDQGGDKAAEMAKERFGEEHADQIDQGVGKAKEGLDHLGGQDDDAP